MGFQMENLFISPVRGKAFYFFTNHILSVCLPINQLVHLCLCLSLFLNLYLKYLLLP